MYNQVLGVELPWLNEITQARTPVRMPVVLTREEVAKILSRLQGVHRLIGKLLYGEGLRIMEAMRLRVKDVDLSRHEIAVRNGKGAKDRLVMLPRSVDHPLAAQLRHVRRVHDTDVAHGYGEVWLPDALARKYPYAARALAWQYVFPAGNRSKDP